MRRLTILLAAAGALMLVSATTASAAPGDLHVKVKGEADGKVITDPAAAGEGEEIPNPTPLISCEWAWEEEKQSGACDAKAELSEPGGPYVAALEAVPPLGSEIEKWVMEGTTGKAPTYCEEGSLKCRVYSFGGELKVRAVFKKAPAAVYIKTDGAGSGKVVGTAEPGPGIPPVNCNWNGETEEQTGVCITAPSEPFPGFSAVSVTHEAVPGSEFAGWEVIDGIAPEESCATFNEECIVFLGAGNIIVRATFESEEEPPVEEPNLAVNVEEGEGTVVSSPVGISCGSECEAAFEEGEKVTLTASPAPGYLFKSWKKCDSGGVNGRQCTVTATSSLKEVGAKFIKVWSLEGSKTGGLGILNTSPGGVNCGYACSSSTALYKQGALTVKNKAAKHYHFVEYAGGTGSTASCNGETTCSVTITEDSSIEEVYAPDAQNTLTLAKEGGGQGFVKTKPTNINCGYTCTAAEASFYASEEAAVTVTLGKGTSSVTWVSGAGTCTGNATSCSVPMSASHSLVAKFN